MTRGEMNWKIVRSVIPIIAMIFFVYYTKNLKTDYTKLDPTLKTTAHDILWRFQMNEGEELLYWDGANDMYSRTAIFINLD